MLALALLFSLLAPSLASAGAGANTAPDPRYIPGTYLQLQAFSSGFTSAAASTISAVNSGTAGVLNLTGATNTIRATTGSGTPTDGGATLSAGDKFIFFDGGTNNKFAIGKGSSEVYVQVSSTVASSLFSLYRGTSAGLIIDNQGTAGSNVTTGTLFSSLTASGANIGLTFTASNGPHTLAAFKSGGFTRITFPGGAPASVAGNGTNAIDGILVGAAGGPSSGVTGETGGEGSTWTETAGTGGAVAGANGIGGPAGDVILVGGTGGVGATTGGRGGHVIARTGIPGTGGAPVRGVFRVEQASGTVATAVEFDGGTAPALSASNEGRIYYDSDSQIFGISANAGAYRGLNIMTYDFGVLGAVTGNATRFAGLGLAVELLNNNIRQPVGGAGLFRNMYVRCNTPPGGATTIAFTLQTDNIDRAVTVTLTGAATTGSDVVNTHAHAATEHMSLKVVTSLAATAIDCTCSIEHVQR